VNLKDSDVALITRQRTIAEWILDDVITALRTPSFMKIEETFEETVVV